MCVKRVKYIYLHLEEVLVNFFRPYVIFVMIVNNGESV